MSVAYRASNSVTNGTAGTSVAVTKPAGTTAGDVLIAFVAETGVGVITAPAGWTLIDVRSTGTDVTMARYYRVAGAAEGATYTWTLGASVRNWGWVGAYTGVDTAAPIFDTAYTTYTTGGFAFFGGTSDLPRFGASVGATAAVRTAGGAATTWSSLHTERADLSTNAGAGIDIAGEVTDLANPVDRKTTATPGSNASQAQSAAVSAGLTLRPYYGVLPRWGDPMGVAVEVAFGADLTADPATWVWTDITTRAKGGGPVRIARGRADRSQETQAARMGVRLSNDDSALTPLHPMSPWYLQWDLGTPVRFSVILPVGRFIRCQGQVSEILPFWPADDEIAFVDVTVVGALHSMGQGSKPIRSALYRNISDDGALAYWAMEDASDATSFADASGGLPLRFAPDAPPSLASSGPVGSAPLPSMGSATVLYAPLVMDAATTTWAVEFYFKVPSAPALDTPVWEWHTNGTIPVWRFTVFPGTTTVGLEGFSSPGVRVVDAAVAITHLYTLGLLVSIDLRQNGGNIEAEWFAADDSGSTYATTAAPVAGTLGVPNQVLTPTYDRSGWLYGHLSVWTKALLSSWSALPLSHWLNLDASTGQNAGARVQTLAGVDVTLRGSTASGAAMGPTPIATRIAIVRECEAADRGVITDGLNAGLDYLPGQARYNRPVVLALDRNRHHIKEPFEPARDDQQFRNDVEVARRNGGRARYENVPVASPRYDDSAVLNLEDDTTLAGQAQWAVHEGTVPELRAPVLTIDLRHTPDLIQPWLGDCDIAERYTAVNLPPQYPPGGLDLLIGGYTETIDAATYRVELTGEPASPWSVIVLDTDRVDTGGSTLAGSETALASGTVDTWSVTTTTGPIWVRTATLPAEFPFDAVCEGEQVTVTAITGASSPQTFTVTRGVNGVVKAHPAGAAVSLYKPAVLAL